MSRQGRKEAAAAAQDLLKLDAARSENLSLYPLFSFCSKYVVISDIKVGGYDHHLCLGPFSAAKRHIQAQQMLLIVGKKEFYDFSLH